MATAVRAASKALRSALPAVRLPAVTTTVASPACHAVEGGADRGGGGVGGLLDEHGAGTREEAGRLDGVEEGGGVAAEVGAGDPVQPHLGGAVRADQRLDERGALQGHPHRVGAEEQDAGEPGVGAGEEALGVAARELHGVGLHVQRSALSARRCTIWSARSTASRRSASWPATRLAKAEAVSDSGAL